MTLPVPGSVFRDLRIHSKLGEGAMGTAWLASHLVLQMPLVVKIYSALTADDLLREAHLAARVAAPEVVGVVDAGVDQGTPFVVQRYVDGIDGEELVGWLAAMGMRLPLGVAARFIADTARGLHAIHQAGVIHRDIKPANIFLAGNGAAMIGDFGIACDPWRHVTNDVIAGTPQFMAPEIWSQQVVSRATDIFALGVTAYLMAGGAVPDELARGQVFSPTLVASLAMQAAQTTGSGAFALGGYIQTVERMVAPNPAQRFRSCGEVARLLAPLAAPPEPCQPIDARRARIGRIAVHLEQGDIAQVAVDVIVNAANTAMHMGVGVSGALLRAGGQQIANEAEAHGEARMGDVVWTGAGALKARYVAHAVAALQGAVCISRCVLRSLLGTATRRQAVIAFPSLGTGVGRVPLSLSAQLTLEAVRTFAGLGPTSITDVVVVLDSEQALAAWSEVLTSL